MRVYLLIILFIYSTYSTGQVQRRFFVEDVKNIEYVTVNFCVNNEAKIYQVTVIENKTNYDNKENIEGLRQYLLGIEFKSSSKLKNGCYDYTFEFINHEYKTKKLSESKYDKCEYFKTGNFEYKHPISKETQLERMNYTQVERNKEFRVLFLIEWSNRCNYILTYEKMTDPKLRSLKGKKVTVEIIDIIDDKNYVYKSKSDFSDEVYYGIIEKIK